MSDRTDVILTDNDPRLVDKGWCFELAGSLVVTGSLIVKLSKWLVVTGGIKAGEGIEAGWGIKACEGIEAGWGIEAGGGIEAGWGIKAKFISCALRIFAGLCLWRFPTEAEMTITSEIRNGTVAFGRVVAPTKDGKASI